MRVQVLGVWPSPHLALMTTITTIKRRSVDDGGNPDEFTFRLFHTTQQQAQRRCQRRCHGNAASRGPSKAQLLACSKGKVDALKALRCKLAHGAALDAKEQLV